MIEDISSNNNKSSRNFSLLKLTKKTRQTIFKRKKTYPNAVVKKFGQQILKFKIL